MTATFSALHCRHCGDVYGNHDFLTRTGKALCVAADGEFVSIDMPDRVSTPTTQGDTITATLTERGKRYGKFTDHAEISRRLKQATFQHAHKQGVLLTFDQQEALDMICHKIGRIVNGDPNYADSWVDIAGYAKLVADRLEGVER